MGGGAGGGGVAGGGWEAEGGLTPPLRDTHSSRVCPVSGTDSHNPQDRPRQWLATAWHHTHPY